MKSNRPDATNEAVRRTMMGNTKRDTSIELILRRALYKRGVHYRKNVKTILGTPDIAIKKYRLVVFCDGDFWHGNGYHSVKSHKRFWDEKIRRNRERDLEYTIRLRDEGWTVLRFWESDIRNDLDGCVKQIIDVINTRKKIKSRKVL